MSTWADVSARLGRNDLPHALATAVYVTQMMTDPADIVDGLSSAWPSAEWPAQSLDVNVWAMLFGDALEPLTYLYDDQVRDRADLPDQVTLYRGAVDGHEYGMSWTDDRDRAHWFAHRFDGIGGDVGKVWQVTVDSDVVMARFDRRGESEWVLDADMLEQDYQVTEVAE